MRKINTLSSSGSRIFKARQLTIGLDWEIAGAGTAY